MNKKIKKLFFSFFGLTTVVVPSFFILASCSNDSNESNQNMITVKDMANDIVTIPKNPSRIICTSRTTYDLLVGFGLSDNVVGVLSSTLQNPWLKEINPESSNKKSLKYKPSVEEMISLKADLILAPEQYIAKMYRDAGLNAVTISLYGNDGFEQHLYTFSNLIKSLFDIDAVDKKVDKWNNDVKETIHSIKSKLNYKKKERLLYVRGDKPLGINHSDAENSFSDWAYTILGFDVYSSYANNSSEPSDEEILKFNPDVMTFGGVRQNQNIKLCKTESKYSSINAVKNNRLFNIPIGFSGFEQISTMTPVFLKHQANLIYPSLFSFDIKTEVRENLKYYFDYSISDQKLDFMLKSLSPTGGELI